MVHEKYPQRARWDHRNRSVVIVCHQCLSRLCISFLHRHHNALARSSLLMTQWSEVSSRSNCGQLSCVARLRAKGAFLEEREEGPKVGELAPERRGRRGSRHHPARG